MSAKRKPVFWPGFQWRILAHKRTGKSSRHGFTGESHEVYAGDRWAPREPRLQGDWEFDELVIDDWFHLEQMDARDWWLGVGNGDDFWHVNIHIDRDGKATVQMKKQ